MKHITRIARKLFDWFAEGDIEDLTYIPPFISLLIILGLGFLAPKLIPYAQENYWFYEIGFIFSSMIFSISGFATVYRREMPGLFGKSVKGWWPVVSGAFFTLFCWGLILVLIWDLVNNWLG